MQVKISNIVHYVGSLFRGFAGVIAGIDASGYVRPVKTDASGKLIVSALEESPQVEVVNVDNAAVLAAGTTPQTEFIITEPAGPVPATRRFTVAAKVTVGSGDIIVEARTGAAGAWVQVASTAISAGGVGSLSYIPAWPRYRVYYKAAINSTGVYLVVMTHPML